MDKEITAKDVSQQQQKVFPEVKKTQPEDRVDFYNSAFFRSCKIAIYNH